MTTNLKEARQKAGYTIDQVSKELKIRKQYIIDLEEGNINNIPGQVYIEGYKRMYHEFLGLDYGNNEASTKNSSNNRAKKYKIQKKTLSNKMIVSFFVILIISFILFYMFGTFSNDLTENTDNNVSNEEAID